MLPVNTPVTPLVRKSKAQFGRVFLCAICRGMTDRREWDAKFAAGMQRPAVQDGIAREVVRASGVEVDSSE